MKKIIIQKKGITLIALVITIIVLLILAGISISMLAGDNSILQKSTEAKRTTERAEAKEQAQMDIMAYIADKTANHQDDSLDDTIVKGILTGKSYVKDGQPGNESFITAKGEYEIPYSELYTASNKIPVVPTTGINYGSKTVETIAVGDDITIGNEKFKIIKKSTDGKTLTAMPYYNLVIKDNPSTIKQATAENAGLPGIGNAGTVAFSSTSSPTWNQYENITLGANESAITTSITNYQTYLRELGANNVEAKIGRFLPTTCPGASITEAEYIGDCSGLNPSGIGCFWLGSCFRSH